MSQSRIDTAKIVLNQIFSLAIRDNYLLTNPVEHATIKLRGKKPKEKIPYTSEQVYMILDYCGEESIYRIVFVLEVFCGLRIGEVLGLDWENVDFENKTIAIEEQMSNVRYEGKSFQVLKRPKSECSRRLIHISDLVIDELKKAKAFQKKNKAEMLEFWLSTWTYPFEMGNKITNRIAEGDIVPDNAKIRNLVCKKRNGGHIQSRNMDQFLEYASKNLGFHATNHIGRHSHATWLLEEGANIVSIGHRLGHNPSSRITYVYLHSNDKVDTELAKSIDSKFSKLNNEVNEDN